MNPDERVLSCDIAIIGGSLGGVAAALAAASAGKTAVLTEATDWLGGQIASQGLSSLHEHATIETFGGTRSYYALRNAIRAAYRDRYQIDLPFLNPGNAWVSRLCFEPRVAAQVIEGMLAPHVAAGLLTVLLEHTLTEARMDGDTVLDVTVSDFAGNRVRIEAALYLDATDLGDLLPLVGAEYVTGAEATEDTGEPHASLDGPRPDEVQAFTYAFATEYRAGTVNTIQKPVGYEYFRDRQPFTLTLAGTDGEARRYYMFRGEQPYWAYRRIFDGRMLNGSNGITLVNWDSNDYFSANLIDMPPSTQTRILNEARRLSLSFLYWLQTEAPRDEGGSGYPELCLRPDVMDTADGLSKMPY
ncbi:MAG: FAD-dependent oxidoreductase, partial [Chloroflexi bacterium]